jgi:hypothetical protein
MSGPGRDSTIQRHGPFCVNPGTLMKHQCFKGTDELFGFSMADSDFNGDASIQKLLNASTGNMRSRVLTANHDSPKPGLNDRVSAGGRFAKVAAWLQRYEQIRAACLRPCGTNRMDFRMGTTEFLVESFSDQLSGFRNDDSSNHGVRFDETETASSNLDGMQHGIGI